MESVLRYLRADHPDAILDAMCKGPEQVREHYGIEAIPLLWYQKYEQRASGVTAIALKVTGKGRRRIPDGVLGPSARCGDRARHGRP